jgi:tRNA (mo5U34)-methyltransferase
VTVQAGELEQRIIELGPWHLVVQVTPEVSTSVWGEAKPETDPGSFLLHDPSGSARVAFRSAYLYGLRGRSVLDVACNCGAYLFWAKELGAGECRGFDVREHWIRQARFLAEHRTVSSTEDMQFDVCDVYDLPKRSLEPADITVFSGIFYHLPDPVSAVKIAADLTNELLLLHTMTQAGEADGRLVVKNEPDDLASGVYGLSWLPTGPEVLKEILSWAGFVETHLAWWERQSALNPFAGSLMILASKKPGLFDLAPPTEYR